MQTSSLDLLEKSELPPGQARAILRVMEMELAASQDVLATRADMAAEFAKIRGEMAEIRIELGKIPDKIDAGDARTQARLAGWVLSCTLSQTVVLLGVIYFLLAHFVK